MSKPTVSEAASLNVQAPVGNLAADTSSTPAAIDLNAWCSDQTYGSTNSGRGRYISITAETTDLYFLFSSAAAASSSTIDASTRVSTAVIQSSASMLKIPELLPAGTTKHYVIDPAYPYLHFVTASASGVVRVCRS